MAAATVLVSQIIGKVWIRGSEGQLTELRVGMRIPVDADIVTAEGSLVQITGNGVPSLTIAENQSVLLTPELFERAVAENAAATSSTPDQLRDLLTAINAGQDPFEGIDPTAAVLEGGGGGGGSYVRLASITEETTELSLVYTPAEADAGTADIFDDADYVAPDVEIYLSTANGVNEGDAVLFELTLSTSLSSDTTFTFNLSGVESDDIGTPSVTIDGADVALTSNSDGSYSVTIPAGVTSGIVVSVPTMDDDLAEGDETLTITGTLTGIVDNYPLPSGITASASTVITDNDNHRQRQCSDGEQCGCQRSNG
jgi:hypothetical protein